MENDAKNLRENLIGFSTGALKRLPKRLREVVAKRFGLKNGREMTLEEIGKDYKISRERIRQIEKAALDKLKEIGSNESAANVFSHLRRIIAMRGGVIGERDLIRIVLNKENEKSNYPAKGALFLTLELDGKMEKVREDNYFEKRWVCNMPLEISPVPFNKRKNFKEENLKRQADFINYLLEFFNSTEEIISSEKLLEMFRKTRIAGKEKLSADLEKEILFSYLEPSKLIGQNYFGQWGLKSWPEIKPRSVKDKIYLALKKEKRPLHFTKITEVINEICQDERLAKSQTVHNELIKDERCVLIGRGIYALEEWGYQNGIVKEVIARILKRKNNPMNQNEIIKEVLKKRIIKKNTVIVNLKNHRCFVRLEDNRYRLRD